MSKKVKKEFSSDPLEIKASELVTKAKNLDPEKLNKFYRVSNKRRSRSKAQKLGNELSQEIGFNETREKYVKNAATALADNNKEMIKHSVHSINNFLHALEEAVKNELPPNTPTKMLFEREINQLKSIRDGCVKSLESIAKKESRKIGSKKPKTKKPKQKSKAKMKKEMQHINSLKEGAEAIYKDAIVGLNYAYDKQDFINETVEKFELKLPEISDSSSIEDLEFARDQVGAMLSVVTDEKYTFHESLTDQINLQNGIKECLEGAQKEISNKINDLQSSSTASPPHSLSNKDLIKEIGEKVKQHNEEEALKHEHEDKAQKNM